MNQAIKLNPNFSTAVVDRGVANYDKNDFDGSIVAADPLIKAKPSYAVAFTGRGSAYENRREGDRIIQEANLPIRNNQYNAFAYSPDTFPPVSPHSAPEPAPVARPAPIAPIATIAPVTAVEERNVPMPQPNPIRPRPVTPSSRAGGRA
jgi:hypothetical protein